MRGAMLNKAAVPCVVCGETVEIGEGHFVKIKGKGWKVQHGQCPAIQRARDALDEMAMAHLNTVRAKLKFNGDDK